jgi:hypothetical protein
MKIQIIIFLILVLISCSKTVTNSNWDETKFKSKKEILILNKNNIYNLYHIDYNYPISYGTWSLHNDSLHIKSYYQKPTINVRIENNNNPNEICFNVEDSLSLKISHSLDDTNDYSFVFDGYCRILNDTTKKICLHYGVFKDCYLIDKFQKGAIINIECDDFKIAPPGEYIIINHTFSIRKNKLNFGGTTLKKE